MKQLIEPIRWGAPSCWTRFLIAGIGIMLTVAGSAQSVPPLVNYQGRLANPDGTPFPTANYELSVRIWDGATNGSMVWGPQVFDGASGLGHGAKIPIVQGYFNLLLGPVDTNGAPLADAFSGAARYVEVTVNNRPPILPRQQVLTTPYAFHAGTVAALSSPSGMVMIPAGSFTMGNSVDADTDITDAAPISTTVSAFYIDVNLVTLSQWQSVYFWAKDHGYSFVNAGAGKAANHPVQTVDWYDCVKWCNARSEQAGQTPLYYTDAGLTQVYTNGEPAALYPNWTAKGYRLPTEAEWEKAARGGLSGQRFPWGNVINQNLANYFGRTSSYAYDLGPNGNNAIGSIGGTSPATSPVGSFAANGYGLNDMAGNVFEWCWDWYGTPYAGGSDPHGPAGPLSYRVLRGGYWGSSANYVRCTNRDFNNPVYGSVNVGFRCVRSL